MILRGRVAIVVLLGLAGCATKGQLRLIETQLMMQDREQERRDSTFQVALTQILRQNSILLDSLQFTRAAINDAKGQSSADLTELQRRLQGLEESQRMANRTMQEYLAELDARNAAAAQPVFDSAMVDSTGGARPGGGGVVTATAAQMLQAGNSQLARSAWSTARSAFQQLLNTHPLSSLAPDAFYGIAQSYALTNPDSALAYYKEVAENYPDSPRAAVAMFKLGDQAQRSGDVAAARQWFQRIRDDRYRGTPEYDLSLSRLDRLP
jgi:TolA-binding protein